MDIRSRFKNTGFILACFALLYMICRDVFNITFDVGIFTEYVTLIMYLIIGAGVVNNPLTGKWYGDNEK